MGDDPNDGGYFENCPSQFDIPALRSFRDRIRSETSRELIQKAKCFQEWTVKKWNPHIQEPTLSIYLGLVAIDEAASKECGAITLDLLLRAGVLIESDDDCFCFWL